jgi:hypothetical protein
MASREEDEDNLREWIANLRSNEEEGDAALANKLARLFYASLGYIVAEGFRFDKSKHPQELAMYDQAIIAITFLREETE